MMTKTPVITKIHEIGPDAVPILGGTPKSLLIYCDTIEGPFYVSLTEAAARQLTAHLTHMFENVGWETTPS
jgi:hypothetical protein